MGERDESQRGTECYVGQYLRGIIQKTRNKEENLEDSDIQLPGFRLNDTLYHIL